MVKPEKTKVAELAIVQLVVAIVTVPPLGERLPEPETVSAPLTVKLLEVVGVPVTVRLLKVVAAVREAAPAPLMTRVEPLASKTPAWEKMVAEVPLMVMGLELLALKVPGAPMFKIPVLKV